MNLSHEIAQQVAVHWTRQLHPRFTGLTDAEYFWEPAPNAWSVRQAPDGTYRADFAVPPPTPEPITTIAWRLNHLTVLFELQQALHGGPTITWQDATPPAPTAQEAVDRLNTAVTTWTTGITTLTPEALAQPTPTEGWTVASLVLHQNRELIHHGAEIALLRDLYPHTH